MLDFETQLELSETLIQLGRLDEAKQELQKAHDLKEAGAFRPHSDSDEVRNAYYERYHKALENVKKSRAEVGRNKTISWWTVTTILTVGLLLSFTAWILSRNRLIEVEENIAATVEAVDLRAEQMEEMERAIEAERTMFVENYRDNSIRLTEVASSSQLSFLAATQAAEALARLEPIEILPDLSPEYANDMCGSAWHRVIDQTGRPAYLTLNQRNVTEESATNSAEWRPAFVRAGNYKVEAFVVQHEPFDWECPTITGIEGDTSSATYVITHARGETAIPIDQLPFSDEYVTLGTFVFNEGNEGFVQLGDETFEDPSTHYVSFGTMRFTWVSAP